MSDRAVIFDLGGVVLRWEPHRAYEQVLAPELVAEFMARIDFPVWNQRHDGGQTFALGEQDLVERFPADEAAILAYRTHFPATLTGMVPGTGAVIAELARAGVGLFALTNWSAETFPYAQQRFGLLRRFAGILVSGAEALAKPDPAIFTLALDRFELDPAATVFVDDSPVNVRAAQGVGLTGLEFSDATRLRHDLVDLGLLVEPEPVSGPIFHLTERTSWAEALQTGRYPWSTRGLTVEAEGFVHCSYPHQWPAIRTAYYGDRAAEDLVLLTLDPARLSVPVVVEDLGAGAYPHLYGELPVGDVVSAAPPTD